MADTPRIEELKRRVQSDPASIAFAALAEEYRRAGRFEEAIAACITGLHRHPSYLSAHVTLGRALIEVGRYGDAREELELVLRQAPENLAAIRGLAEIHHRLGGQPEGAAAPPPQPPRSAPPRADPPLRTGAARVAEGPVGTGSWKRGGEAAPVPPPPPLTDPSVRRLEAFLDAIIRAREGGAAPRG